MQTKKEFQLTNNTRQQQNPKIFKDKVVYEDCRNGNIPQIFVYNLTTKNEFQITNNAAFKGQADIYENKIVYTSNNNDTYYYLEEY